MCNEGLIRNTTIKVAWGHHHSSNVIPSNNVSYLCRGKKKAPKQADLQIMKISSRTLFCYHSLEVTVSSSQVIHSHMHDTY